MYTVGSKHFHDYDKVKVTAGNLPVVVFSNKSNLIQLKQTPFSFHELFIFTLKVINIC